MGTRQLASDNYAGVLPEVLAELARVNDGHATPYGADPVTAELADQVRGLFGPQAQTFPVFNGTGANVLALAALLPRWGAVVCADCAHIATDENAAPQRVAGTALLTVPHRDGKVTVAQLQKVWARYRPVHGAQPLVVSLTQPTELGTIYSPGELAAIVDWAREHGLAVHVDGARLGNAAAATGRAPAELVRGADVVSFGGTKAGALGAEAVVVLSPDRVGDVEQIRKLTGQLASKMRFVSAQLVALLRDDLWIRAAADANARAARLADRLMRLGAPVEVAGPVEVNAVFVTLPREVAEAARAVSRFYDWDPDVGPGRVQVRLVTSWDTTDQDVDAVVAAISGALGR